MFPYEVKHTASASSHASPLQQFTHKSYSHMVQVTVVCFPPSLYQLSAFFRTLDACAWREFNMAAYLVCLTTDGGIPLFTRTKGNLPQLPFPVIGSLNGVCMFANNQDVTLLNTVTDDAKVVWKVFNERITLIIVASDDNASDLHLNRLLDFVFNSMVLLLGIDELTSFRNVELLKRELRCCYSLIDSLLEGTELTGNITQAVDIILCPDVSFLQEFLDAFATAVSSEFGCLLVMGKVAVATERWWELTGMETVLLSLLVYSLPPWSSRDIPIYLPYGSPKIPHRLLTFQLIEGVEVCVICGPKPTLQDAETKFLDQYWRLAIDTLNTSRRSHPRNLPGDMVLDSGILGFVLVNTDEHKSLSSVHPSGVLTGVDQGSTSGSGMSTAKRKSILVSFYKSVVGTLFPVQEPNTSEQDSPSGVYHQAMETYICASDHKCYAIRTATHELFLLFSNEVPTYALGLHLGCVLSLLESAHVNECIFLHDLRLMLSSYT
ncbi:protein fuzzy homolog isoform X3 [Pocillopora verrucosa]|uniref:protein fuzzy homolog isoform X3 n=1 Tax=Pocillopora verrucosa TaxID=203993 RepID=UPI0033415788